MVEKVVMPAAGQTTDVATVTKLKVSVGDSVKKGDVLLEVETDKAVLPIESFAKGFVTEIFVNEFDTVDAGTVLLAIGDANDLEAAKNGKTEKVEADGGCAKYCKSGAIHLSLRHSPTERKQYVSKDGVYRRYLNRISSLLYCTP